MKNQKGFIQQTAQDYDMSYEQVEQIYIKYYKKSPILFYEKLEEFIQQRAK